MGIRILSFEIYVRSIIYSSLDPEQKDALVEIIEKLLQDKTTVSIQIN